LQAAEQRKRRRAQLALCAAVGVLLLGGGAFAWWSGAQRQAARERQARNAEAVAGLLDQCEAALRGGDTARAAVTLEAAQKRAEEGGAEASAARLDALAADLALLRDFDESDRLRWSSDRRFYDLGHVAASYGAALGRYGVGPDAVSPEEAAARVSGSVVRDRITAAWDWMLFGEKRDWVRAALQAIDADPYRDAVRDAVMSLRDQEKFAELVGQPQALEQSPEFTAFLGDIAMMIMPARERGRQLLEAAVSRRPGNLGLLITLYMTYPSNDEQSLGERLRWCQAAVAAGPTSPIAHYNLGGVLREKQDLAGAEAAAREAIRLDPKYVHAHCSLALTLRVRKDLDGAEAAAREAIRLDPKYLDAHCSLALTLRVRKDLDGAEAAVRELIRLVPTRGFAYSELGDVLRDRKDVAGAEAAYREAVRLDPKDDRLHFRLADFLYERKDLAGAEVAYREAFRIRPNYPEAHNGLGNVLYLRNDLTGAEAAYREALRLAPRYAIAQSNLGNVLYRRKDLTGAEAAYREALRLAPRYVDAHKYLGWVLALKGDLDGAVAEFKEVLQLDPKDANALTQLPKTERTRALLARLPDVLDGKTEPATPIEACEFAELCAQPFQKRYAAAARLSERAFVADPKLAADLKAIHRYNAARFAVRAAGGEGIDPPADAAARTALRQKALVWLRADLDLQRKQAASADGGERGTAAAKLAHWLVDTDLAGVRDPEPLAKLPAAERSEWEKFWADVKATLADARKPVPGK
jgi:tetratricopeptide (TPR) repeat protein